MVPETDAIKNDFKPEEIVMTEKATQTRDETDREAQTPVKNDDEIDEEQSMESPNLVVDGLNDESDSSMDEITDITCSREDLDDQSDIEEQIEYFNLSNNTRDLLESVGNESKSMGGLEDNRNESENLGDEDDCTFSGAMYYHKSDYVNISDIKSFPRNKGNFQTEKDDEYYTADSDVDTEDGENNKKNITATQDTTEPQYFILDSENPNFDNNEQKSDGNELTKIMMADSSDENSTPVGKDDSDEDWSFLASTNFSFLSNNDTEDNTDEQTKETTLEILTLDDISINDDDKTEISPLTLGVEETVEAGRSLGDGEEKETLNVKFLTSNAVKSPPASEDDADKYDLKSLFEEAWMVTLKRRRRFFEELASRDSDG